jgi:hypothetical protein
MPLEKSSAPDTSPDLEAHGRWQQQEGRAPARQNRLGRLALIKAALLAPLAIAWAIMAS